MQNSSNNAQSSKKVSFWSIIKILAGFLLILFVLSRADLAELVALAAQVSWGWFGLTFVLFILLSMLKAWQYYALFEADFSYFQILSVVILQNSISNFVASGAGLVAYLAILQAEQGVKMIRSASVFVIIKVGDLIAVWLALIISLFFVGNQVKVIHSLVLFLIVLISVGITGFGAMVFLRHKFVDVFRRILEWMGLLKFRPIQNLLGLADSLADLDQKKVTHMSLVTVSLSLIYLIFTVAWSYSSLHTFNLPVTIWVVVFVNSILQLLSIIPVQVFGGLGFSEIASLYFFGIFGFPEGQLAAVLIGVRLLFYLTNLTVLLYLPFNTFFLRHTSTNNAKK